MFVLTMQLLLIWNFRDELNMINHSSIIKELSVNFFHHEVNYANEKAIWAILFWWNFLKNSLMWLVYIT